MGQADEVSPHINPSCQHARNITEKWNENFPRALNARSPLASRCCTSLRDCVAAQSNRAHAHEDPTTGRSAQPSQIHDVEVLAILSPCESQSAAARRSNSSNAWMCSYPASDKSRAFAFAQTSRLLQEPADSVMILQDTITPKYSSTRESEADKSREARSPRFKSSNSSRLLTSVKPTHLDLIQGSGCLNKALTMSPGASPAPPNRAPDLYVPAPAITRKPQTNMDDNS